MGPGVLGLPCFVGLEVLCAEVFYFMVENLECYHVGKYQYLPYLFIQAVMLN